MKVAVLNYTGSVGKTVVASHLLAPRMNGAQIFAVESTNETGADLGLNVDQLRGEHFGRLFRELLTRDDAIVDVGASNIEDFLTHMMRYEGAHEEMTQFYGIEIDDFAHEIATLSLWLAEHQMNTAFKDKFGYAEAVLPLRDGGNVVCENSLRLDWEDVCPPVDEHGNACEVYICGNPPFLGTTERSAEQSADMKHVFSSFKSIGYPVSQARWCTRPIGEPLPQ